MQETQRAGGGTVTIRPNIDGRPLLDWDKEATRQAMKEAVEHWVGLGVDGFHLTDVDQIRLSSDWDSVYEVTRLLRNWTDELLCAHDHCGERMCAILH